MDDEHRLNEVDSRVRAALRADVDITRRVIASALAGEPPAASHRWRIPLVIVTTAVVVVLAVGVFEWRRRTAGSIPPSLTITSVGSMLVVESPDGRRWVVGRSQPRRSGNYVMVVH
jgi:hypothetical protein